MMCGEAGRGVGDGVCVRAGADLSPVVRAHFSCVTIPSKSCFEAEGVVNSRSEVPPRY